MLYTPIFIPLRTLGFRTIQRLDIWGSPISQLYHQGVHWTFTTHHLFNFGGRRFWIVGSRQILFCKGKPIALLLKTPLNNLWFLGFAIPSMNGTTTSRLWAALDAKNKRLECYIYYICWLLDVSGIQLHTATCYPIPLASLVSFTRLSASGSGSGTSWYITHEIYSWGRFYQPSCTPWAVFEKLCQSCLLTIQLSIHGCSSSAINERQVDNPGMNHQPMELLVFTCMIMHVILSLLLIGYKNLKWPCL